MSTETSSPGGQKPFGPPSTLSSAPGAYPPGPQQSQGANYWTGPLPPKRKRPMAGWKLALLIVGALLLVFVLGVVAFGLLFYFGQQEQPVRDADRAVMLTADKVQKHFELTIKKKHEKIKKVKNIDSSYELTYEYDLPEGLDGKGKSALVIQCNLTVDTSRSDAVASYHANRLGVKAGLYKEGMSEKASNDLFRWGDASHFSIVSKGDDVVFYTFQARKGKKVWSLIIGGVLLDNLEIIKSLLADVLSAVETYTP